MVVVVGLMTTKVICGISDRTVTVAAVRVVIDDTTATTTVAATATGATIHLAVTSGVAVIRTAACSSTTRGAESVDSSPGYHFVRMYVLCVCTYAVGCGGDKNEMPCTHSSR